MSSQILSGPVDREERDWMRDATDWRKKGGEEERVGDRKTDRDREVERDIETVTGTEADRQ